MLMEFSQISLISLNIEDLNFFLRFLPRSYHQNKGKIAFVYSEGEESKVLQLGVSASAWHAGRYFLDQKVYGFFFFFIFHQSFGNAALGSSRWIRSDRVPEVS